MKELLTSFLDSRQWTSQSHNTSEQLQPLLEWSSSGTSVYFSLVFFLLMKVQPMQRSMKSSFYLSRNPKKAATPLVPLYWVTATHNWNTVIDIFTIE